MAAILNMSFQKICKKNYKIILNPSEFTSFEGGLGYFGQ
jgi:hypothetical protein